MMRLIAFSKKYIWNIIIAAIGCIIGSIANVWVIDILKNIINESLTGNMNNLPLFLLQGGFIIVIGMVSNYLIIYMTGYFSAGVLKDIRKVTMEHIVKLSPEFIEKNDYGDIITRMSSDVQGISWYLGGYFKDCIYVPIMVVIYSVYLCSVNVLLAAFCIFPLCILVPLSIKLMDPIKKSQFEYVQKLGATNNNIQEMCDGIAVVKSYHMEDALEAKYYIDLKKTLDISNINDLRQYHIEPISSMISELPVAIALCLGGYFVFQHQVNIGVLVAFISIMKKMIDPLERAYQLIVRTKMALVSVERVFYILDYPVENKNTGEDETAILAACSIETTEHVFELEHVSFAYDGLIENKNALEDINLVIRKGEKTAFVGRSGGGKSTLLKLLYEHYQVTNGVIRYCGQDYSEINPEMIRKNIALISQDIFLFPMSIKDNIRIGNPIASDEEVITASKLANCHDFIMELPEGYDTLAGEKGTFLSGGQKQRVSIARAILKNCEVILLDEPTSALDNESEKLVNEALDRITHEKTVVVVAHRMSTIINSDKIVVVDNGSIREIGKHDELMKDNGIYAQLYCEYDASTLNDIRKEAL